MIAAKERLKLRPPAQRKKKTPPQVAERYGVDVMKVLAWTKSGELKAMNGATKLGGRPRYLIDDADLETFEQARAIIPEAKPARRRRQSVAVKTYFPE